MTNFVLCAYMSNPPVLHHVRKGEESHLSGSAQNCHSTNMVRAVYRAIAAVQFSELVLEQYCCYAWKML